MWCWCERQNENYYIKIVIKKHVEESAVNDEKKTTSESEIKKSQKDAYKFSLLLFKRFWLWFRDVLVDGDVDAKSQREEDEVDYDVSADAD